MRTNFFKLLAQTKNQEKTNELQKVMFILVVGKLQPIKQNSVILFS